MPEIDFAHLERLTDDTGIIQHAVFSVPNRDYGYCTDDNARALIIATRALALLPENRRLRELSVAYLSYLHHAFDRKSHNFHNFMGYDRRWLDQKASADCYGRAMWALAVVASESRDEHHRALATDLFRSALPAAEALSGLRPVAYSVLGLEAWMRPWPDDLLGARLLELLAGRLLDRFRRNGSVEWPWAEDLLTYGNGRVPQALLAAGRTLGRPDMVETGLQALEWLVEIQTTDGHFAPVGNAGWYRRGSEKARVDQQPIEADGTLAACVAAYRATGQRQWLDKAQMCFRWFLGDNDLGLPLYDSTTGGCRDGLNSNSVNQNQGAESTLAWLSCLIQVHLLRREGLAAAQPDRVHGTTRSKQPA